jgi:Uma2 family endonuclease
MNAPTKLRMTADEFIRWAMEQAEGQRYELADGEVFPMSPERFGHIETKGNVYFALRLATQRCAAPCRVYVDGASIRIDDSTVYEPDVIVRCGEPLSKDAVETSDPVIVVEVLSPSTRVARHQRKADRLFSASIGAALPGRQWQGGKPDLSQARRG